MWPHGDASFLVCDTIKLMQYCTGLMDTISGSHDQIVEE